MSNAEMVQEINSAIGAHGAWKLKLRVAITTGTSEVAPEKVCKDDRCPFGRWIYGPTLDSMTRAGKPYQVVRRLHAEFHQSAADVLRLALAARKADADAMFQGTFAERSDKLVRALTKWKGELL